MKRSIFWILLSASMLLLSGCTKTIEGIQGDASDAWHGTKRVIHDATED